jgi:hypothetical protein
LLLPLIINKKNERNMTVLFTANIYLRLTNENVFDLSQHGLVLLNTSIEEAMDAC